MVRRRGATSIRFDRRPIVTCTPFAAQRNGARAAIDDASHRFGWVVHGRIRPGTRGALRRVNCRTLFATSRAADSIRRLRSLAEKLVARREAGRTTLLLEIAIGKCPATAQTTDR